MTSSLRVKQLKTQTVFRVIMGIAMGAMAVGQANSFAPDYGKAKEAAAKCLALHDREPAINSYDESGKQMVSF